MKTTFKLRMTAAQRDRLKTHLYPGDGFEAVALALCGRASALDTEVLVVHDIHEIPYESCERSESRVSWSPAAADDWFERAACDNLAVLKVHSHPGGYPRFSNYDDESDRTVFESVYGWVDSDSPHGSVVMLPGGALFGRVVLPDLRFKSLDVIEVVGDDIECYPRTLGGALREFTKRHRQLFGDKTTHLLGTLRIAVVGCSGTGSIVIQQLGRLGVGELVLVDPDRVEEKNLNRIVGATREDASAARLKTEAMAREVRRMGLGTQVYEFPHLLEVEDAIRAVSTCDIVMGCMDSLSGRNLLSRLCRWYVLPYVDVGVKLEALSDGTINQVAGAVHFLRPDGGNFLDRGVFTAAALEAEDLYRADPEEYARRLEEGYVHGVVVERPAVVSVNTTYAGLAVQELLGRVHPYRMEPNGELATTRLSLSGLILEHDPERGTEPALLLQLGRGNASPLLGMPHLGREVTHA